MMFVSRAAIVCALGFGLLLVPGLSPAGDPRSSSAGFRSSSGQEVVNGSYQCIGTVYTDGQAASVSAYSYISATSGITSNFFGNGQSFPEVPADLDAMAALCDAHLGQVLPEVPPICFLGAVRHERGEFGNGASTSAVFDFSCQGTRDEVIGVIGVLSRAPLLAPES